MSQADNYTPQSVLASTATIEVVLPWTFDGINELIIIQTDGVTTGAHALNDFDAFVVGQTVTVENFYGDGNLSTVSVARDTKKTQEFTQLETNPLDSSGMNTTLDKIVRMIQDTAFKTDQLLDDSLTGDLANLLLKAITSDDPFIIPPKGSRENVYFAFDSNGDILLTVPPGIAPPAGPIPPDTYLTVLTDIKVLTGTSYTLLEADAGKFLIFTNAADIEITTPNDLSRGHQSMYLKTGATNEITHTAAAGAIHANTTAVVASKQYAWYSHVIFENILGVAAEYRFIGEIDEIDISNIEVVSRTILIEAGTTGPDAQLLIDAAGKYLNAGVELKILFQDMTLIVTQAIIISDFMGPGILTVETLTDIDPNIATSRMVSITNSNTPLVSEYADPIEDDNELNWAAYLANSCLFISGNTCSQVNVGGFSLSAKVFPMVMTANTAAMDVRYNYFNQINAFTLAEYEVAAGLRINGGMGYVHSNKYTTDTDTNGHLLHGCQIHLSEPAGDGGYLVLGGSGVAVSYDAGAFTASVDLYKINGFWSTGEASEGTGIIRGSDANGSWTIHPDGFIEQRGIRTTSGDVVFPVPFTSPPTHYWAILRSNTSGSNDNGSFITSVTTTTLTRASQTTGCYWYAEGS